MTLGNIQNITAASIKKIKELHDKKGRLNQGLFIAEGIRICSTLIESSIALDTLYVTNEMYKGIQPEFHSHNVIIVSETTMRKISTSHTPSGVLGIFQMPIAPQAEMLTPGLVLLNITDPGNMGTLIRTCVAVGARSVVIVDGVDPFNPKVIQASAGTIGSLNIFQWSWNAFITQNNNRFPLHALVVTGGVKPTYTTIHNGLIIVGNEAHGIPSTYLAQVTTQVTIPMPGNTESLNAAVAGSIALYLGFVEQ